MKTEVTQPADEKFPAFKDIISCDPKINRMKEILGMLAHHKSLNILLIGESGTGKKSFAKAYHETMGKDVPSVAVNCGSVSENLFEREFFGYKKGAFPEARENHKGYFERANGGVLFLHEISELNMKCQSYLLKFLIEREIIPIGGIPKKIIVNIVSTANLNLYQKIANGEFRHD